MNSKETCIKPGCNAPGERSACGTRNGKSYFYCAKHYRMKKMREVAKRDGKYVPGMGELDRLLSDTDNMKCPKCDKTMKMLKGEDRTIRDLVTLQHNHNGTIELICHSCNSRHAHSKIGDNLWSTGESEKYCPDCDTVKPFSAFYKNKRTFTGLQDTCKPCSSQRQKLFKKTGVSYAH